MDAIRRLATTGAECCAFYRSISETDIVASGFDGNAVGDVDPEPVFNEQGVELADEGLNASQRRARDMTLIRPLSLVWGPPGMYEQCTICMI